MTTWWQVYDYPHIWGFKSVDGVVRDVPREYLEIRGLKLTEVRNWFTTKGFKVVKIADINY